MALWKSVARSVRPRRAEDALEQHDQPQADTPAPEPAQPTAAKSQPPTSTPAPKQRPHGEPVLHRLGPSTPGLDRNTARRLRQGRTPPEARIDLHGMTVARAHDALVAFIRREHGAGSRCVLVITGKGQRREAEHDPARGWRAADGGGVLKSMTPQWLGQAPCSAMVVGVYPAHQRHGGEGAFYVYLRKRNGGS